MPRTIRRRRGFSLLELMVVIVIIGVLAALALPAVRAGMRERRKSLAAAELVRTLHRTRSRSIATGRAHMVRYTATDNGGHGALYVVRARTNRCGQNDFVAPVATQCTASTTNVCEDWWIPTTYDVTGGNYTIDLARVAGLDAAPTATSIGNLDLCFDGRGMMATRTSTSARFSDTAPTSGVFVFLVRALVGSSDPGVVRRIVVPFGGEARIVQ